MNRHKVKFRLLQLLLAYFPWIYLIGRRARRLFRRKAPVEMRSSFPSVSREGFRVLVIDRDFPDPARDAGSKAIFHLVNLLLEEGMEVAFWSASTFPSEYGRALLSKLGVETAARCRGRDLMQWLSGGGRNLFNAAILSRPIVASMYYRDVREFASNRCLYYGHDIHHWRLASMRSTRITHQGGSDQWCMARIEHSLWRKMDVVFYPSEREVAAVNDYRQSKGLLPNAVELPLWSIPDSLLTPVSSPFRRRGMLFVGSYSHAPNADGLDWFFTEVLPKVRGRGCFETVYIVGADMELYRPPTDDSCVIILGWLSDDALEELYGEVRVALVPLRYGSGVKGKVLEAMSRGVPCATTSVGAQGLTPASAALAPVDGADQFAETIVALFEDDAMWKDRANAGLTYMAATHRRSILLERVVKALRGGNFHYHA